MKPSRFVYQLAFKNVLKKKQRTRLSLISVTLSTAVIFVSLILFYTVFALSKNIDQSALGTSHYMVESAECLNQNPFRFHVSSLSIGEETLEDYPAAYLTYNDEAQFFTLIEGTLPGNEQEILVPAETSLNVGDQLGDYIVVGIYQPTHFYQTHLDLLPVMGLNENWASERSYYFIRDDMIQNEESLSSVAHMCQVDTSQIFLNSERISNDTIINYLNDTTTMLMMFIAIIAIAIWMSLVSIYNVLIVNDQDLRQEIGLLKSIGMMRRELKRMLLCELGYVGFAGSLMGMILGGVISAIVLQLVLSSLNAAFQLSMVLQPWALLLAFVAGNGLMVGSGFFVYRHYLYSKPIEDLKGNVVQYDVPYDSKRFSIYTATWQMFVIYNERMKKQTRNLRRSFFLMIFTITLLCGIAFSNFLYLNRYQNVDADFMLEPSDAIVLGEHLFYPELDQAVYVLGENEETAISRMNIQRVILGLQYFMPANTFTDYYTANSSVQGTMTINDEIYYNDGYRSVVFDAHQIEELEPYVVAGSLTDLTEDSVILTINQHMDFIRNDPIRSVEPGTEVIVHEREAEITQGNTTMKVAAVVDFPEKDLSLQYSDISQYRFGMIFTSESYAYIHGANTTTYNMSLCLINPANRASMAAGLERVLSEQQLSSTMVITDYLQIQNDGQFAVFMISMLMYPLLVMLVIIGIININNVLKGNIHMKHMDFSTMKSVGMTSAQLRMIMLYEYAENYINAGLLTFILCIPVYLIEQVFSMASVFRIGDNFTGMFVISFMLVSPIIVVILAILSFKELNQISAIDGMKDIV